MKNLIIAILAFLLFFAGAAPTNKIVEYKNEVYAVKYSEELEQPLEVTYTIACTETKFSRAGLDFVVPTGIHTSDNADYAGNEYDKGHMAPAADFACDQKMLALTFSYLNCALQQENLNRGVWRFLEVHERDLATYVTTTVTIKCHFSAASTKLPTGATIPDGFTKIIKSGKITETYYFPNVRPTKKSYIEYLVVNK